MSLALVPRREELDLSPLERLETLCDHGSLQLIRSGEATVPRITVIKRKAFGGAFITMNSKDLGVDYVFAWPQAEIGVMGVKPAVGIIHRRELDAAPDREEATGRLAAEYPHTQLRPQVAARSGHVDELIAPSETRERLAWALRSLKPAA